MKLPLHTSRLRRQAGILLTECLVYIAVFAILLGIGTATFYFCWDHTRAIVLDSNDIESALRAGERWRVDVRSAIGPIAVETASDGETVTIPETGKQIIYHFQKGEIRRQTASSDFSELLLPSVKTSMVKPDTRGQVKAWRWELEVTPQRKDANLPFLFTFEAVQPSS
jgi:hypothetical protein